MRIAHVSSSSRRRPSLLPGLISVSLLDPLAASGCAHRYERSPGTLLLRDRPTLVSASRRGDHSYAHGVAMWFCWSALTAVATATNISSPSRVTACYLRRSVVHMSPGRGPRGGSHRRAIWQRDFYPSFGRQREPVARLSFWQRTVPVLALAA